MVISSVKCPVPRSRMVKAIGITAFALLVLPTTTPAGDRCVNYISGVPVDRTELAAWPEIECGEGGCAVMSFNPRTRASIIVASIDAMPTSVLWETDFGAVILGNQRLEWRLGAVPTRIPRESRSRGTSNEASTRQLGRTWKAVQGEPPPTFDAPADRKIDVGYDGGETYDAFGTPVTWTNTETGEKKALTERPVPDDTGGTSHPLEIATADHFILIEEMFGGANAIVADMNTGEVLLRAGDHSKFARWGKCPAQVEPAAKGEPAREVERP
jgi:hypothetical protein